MFFNESVSTILQLVVVQKRIEQHERESPQGVEVPTKPIEESKIQEEEQTFSNSYIISGQKVTPAV